MKRIELLHISKNNDYKAVIVPNKYGHFSERPQ